MPRWLRWTGRLLGRSPPADRGRRRRRLRRLLPRTSAGPTAFPDLRGPAAATDSASLGAGPAPGGGGQQVPGVPRRRSRREDDDRRPGLRPARDGEPHGRSWRHRGATPMPTSSVRIRHGVGRDGRPLIFMPSEALRRVDATRTSLRCSAIYGPSSRWTASMPRSSGRAGRAGALSRAAISPAPRRR